MAEVMMTIQCSDENFVHNLLKTSLLDTDQICVTVFFFKVDINCV